jgi:hypothetical protein
MLATHSASPFSIPLVRRPGLILLKADQSVNPIVSSGFSVLCLSLFFWLGTETESLVMKEKEMHGTLFV